MKVSRFENYYHGDEDAFDGPGGRSSALFKPVKFACLLQVWLLTHFSPSLVVMHILIMGRSGLLTNIQ